MNSNTKRLGFAGGIAALAALVPTPAFAEAPSGADLLLPKMAEFIPALIAFLEAHEPDLVDCAEELGTTPAALVEAVEPVLSAGH